MPEGSRWAIRVNGVVALRLRGPQASERAREVARRLGGLPAHAHVTLAPDEGFVDVYVSGRRVVRVDRLEARANHTSPYALAAQWAQRLQTALSVRTLSLPTSTVVLPVGGSELVKVRTVPPGQPAVGPYDHRVVDVRWEDPQRLRLVGKAVGKTTVPLQYGPARRELHVWVRPLAGRLPDRVEAVVTGDPAPADVVWEAVLRSLERASRTEPGAFLEATRGELPALRPGEAWEGALPARIRSPFALPVEGQVSVTVRNQQLELAAPSRLLISNNPERISADGILFREVVGPGESVRMLYHHQNGAARDKVVTVWLRNPNPRPARVHLQLASPNAWHDTMGVGHAAARRFLELVGQKAGYVLELPARGDHRFTTQRTPPEHVVSGLLQVQVLEGGPLEVSVSVRTPYVLDRAVRWELGPDEKTHPRGVFGAPQVDVQAELVVGQPWSTEIGRSRQLRDLRTGTLLEGDYGVTYRLRLSMYNPTDAPVTVELVLVAASGPAYATFLVDGQLVDLRFLAAGRSAPVFSATLGPREVRPVELVTIPEAASWYPVRLHWRTR
ncbi:MAG: hypothetical protein RMM30_05530 [Armatimonadota bacterium]|nr:hypothetical protein [Armatimonadota bacterium]MDW8156030.1 hypothetical protein [Armatimonadota bacterium]